VLAGDFKLATLVRDLAVARLKFRKQPHVLDGNDGLVGKGFEEGWARVTAMTPTTSSSRNIGACTSVLSRKYIYNA